MERDGAEERLFQRLAQRVREVREAERSLPMRVSLSPDEIDARLRQRYSFREPVPLETVFEDADRWLHRDGEHASNPGYFGVFRPATDRAGVLAEALVALHGPNLAVRRVAPAAAGIERHVLRTVASCFGPGFDPGGSHFTSGGQEANHTAALVALHRRFPRIHEEGLRSLEGAPRMYASAEAHHSLDKVAVACGIGQQGLRRIPTDAAHRMDLRALEGALKEDAAAGDLPFLVVGTAGSTSAGALDPLAGIVRVAGRHGAWVHVDAAWAGAAALSPRLRPRLAGIEEADSISCDAHKWLGSPVGAGMFLCRHARSVRDTFQVHTEYAPPIRGDWNGYCGSMQWSRRHVGLSLFFLLAELGLDGLARRLDAMDAMGEQLRRMLQERGWSRRNRTPFPLVCFTHPRLQGDRRRHRRLALAVQEGGTSWISTTVLPTGEPVLRAAITHHRSGPQDLEALGEALDRALAEVCPEDRESPQPPAPRTR